MSNATATIDATSVLFAIANGDLDTSLDSIIRSAQNRKRSVATEGLRIGGVATITDIKPKYLVGQKVRIIKVNTKTANVVFLNPEMAGRFRDSDYVRVPLPCLAPAEEG